jgi:hypothetical protein
MSSIRLSKSRLMKYLQCPKQLHLQTFRPELAEDSVQTLRAFSVGHGVGEVARRLVSNGLLIEHDANLTGALAATQAALKDEPTRPLFEATFQHDGVLIRADVLTPSQRRHRLTEVKASGDVKPHYVRDCAIQTWVVEGSGLLLDKIELAHVDTSFVYPGEGDYRGLLEHEDITDPVRSLIYDVRDWVDGARQVLAGPEPTTAPGDQCKDPYLCPFIDHCSPPESGYPVTLLPSDRGKGTATSLKRDGFNDIRDIPDGYLTNPKYEWIRRVTVAGAPDLNPKVADVMRQFAYPRYYLDFETIQFAVPIWKGTSPYQMLPFQWSCHSELADGELRHEEFLGFGPDAPMRTLAEQLLTALSRHGEGPIFVYSGFEGGRIRGLSASFPDLSDRLERLIERLVDLLPITRAYYYHPEMKGSWSIKAVLPTIAPELSYSGLGEIQDGGGAGVAYLEILDPATNNNRRDALLHDLREYCKRDTLAMVKLARYFSKGTA